MNVDFNAIKIDYKFFCPKCGKVVYDVFRIRPLLAKKQ